MLEDEIGANVSGYYSKNVGNVFFVRYELVNKFVRKNKRLQILIKFWLWFANMSDDKWCEINRGKFGA